MYVDTGSPVLYIPSKSRDLADENNKILTEWKRFEIIVLAYEKGRKEKLHRKLRIKQKDHHKKWGTQVRRNSGTRRNADFKYPMFDLR